MLYLYSFFPISSILREIVSVRPAIDRIEITEAAAGAGSTIGSVYEIAYLFCCYSYTLYFTSSEMIVLKLSRLSVGIITIKSLLCAYSYNFLIR